MNCPSRAGLTNPARFWVAAVITTVACSHALKSTSSRAPARPDPDTPSVTQLRQDIDAVLATPALEHGYWGGLVKSLKTRETLYSLNPRKLMMPASNMKIVILAPTV